MAASSVDPHVLTTALELVRRWEERFGQFDAHPAQDLDSSRLIRHLERYVARLNDNYPFFHPRYAGQMLKPPHPVAVAGYLAAMLINPNNHALDGGPATAAMEKEVVAKMASVFGFPDDSLGHLTTSGTIANLEALWIGRELHPEKGILISDQAHYTHARMAGLLRMPVEVAPSDDRGRIDVDAVEAALRSGRVGTVVATAGTTGLGAVDPIADLLPLVRRYDARLHVDAAYGGFFALLAQTGGLLTDETARHLLAAAEADSFVVDPHKHGLQPYGCGCLIFRDASVGRFYKHDSPYTYFTSDELHLGEISLECSRAGAAAGALWLTIEAIPLTERGLGSILAACRRAAVRFAERLDKGEVFATVTAPELDVVAYYVRSKGGAAAIDAASQHVFDAGMDDPDDPIYLSLLRLPGPMLGLADDAPSIRVLRSVLMKPEHESSVDWLADRLDSFAREVLHGS